MKSKLTGLTQEHRAAAEHVLAGLRGQFDLAFYSGSLVAGLGHATSDIDVHVVLRDGVHLERRTFDVGKHVVQLTILPLPRLRHIAALGGRLTATTTDRAQFELDNGTLWDVLRTGSGLLIEGHGEAAALFASIDPNVVRQVLMGNHAHPVARFAKDAYGLLRTGSAQSAYVCSIQALGSGLELALAAGGDSYAVPKFQFARLARSVYAGQSDQLWQLTYAGPPAPTVKDIEPRLWAAASLAANGLLNGWESAITDVAPLEPAGAGVVRSPYWSLMRYADGYALAGPATPLRLAAPVARLWAALDGRPIHDLIRITGANSAARVREAISTLIKAGAASDESRVSP